MQTVFRAQSWVIEIFKYSTVFVNFGLKFVVTSLVRMMGFSSITNETKYIMVLVFLIQFFNTGPLLLLVNADLSQFNLPLLNLLDAGVYTDFGPKWYGDVGQAIVTTMLFNMVFPIIEFFIFGSIRFLRRMADRGCSMRRRTKKTLLYDYLELYLGPKYQIHVKYSYILNVTYITFMFGAGMPILFPIALGSFIIKYAMERLQLAYSYQVPPMYDESLNRTAIKYLLFAPFMYLTIGYWMLDNVQIFNNRVYFRENFNQHEPTGHDFKSMLRPQEWLGEPSTPLLLMLFGKIGLFLTRPLWYQRARRYWLNKTDLFTRNLRMG